jgi:acyl-CoA synthetase (AMP-forming)/AMP-acid ligase II
MNPTRIRPNRLTGEKLSRIQINEWIDLQARQSPNVACLVTPERSATFAEIRDRVHRLAGGMRAAGLCQGDRVAILATDSIEYVETVLALFKVGAIVVPLNFRLSAQEIGSLLRTAEASWIFAGERYVPMLTGLRSELPALRHVVGMDDTAGTTPFTSLIEGGPAGLVPTAEVADEDIIVLAFTSGTTGLPKGVMQSHRMWKNMCSNATMEYRFRRDQFRYSASPLCHVAGFNLMLKTLDRGSTSLMLPQWNAAEILPWFRNGLTDVFLVPTMLADLLRQPDVTPADFRTLRSVLYGAAPMSPALLERAMAVMDCEFTNGFGAGTEAGMQSVLSPEDHLKALNGHPHLLGSVGRPGYNVDLQIWDEHNQEVPAGTVGEIVTRSDMVMSGYLGQPEKTAEVVVDGWFKGGDLGYLDDDGYLYLAGRKHDMIIRGGENIYPIEIESVLAAYPGVVECAVVGAPDEFWGEVVHAHLYVDAAVVADPDRIKTFCRDRLARYKVPDEIVVHDQPLEKNASGKILRRLLRGAA